MCVIATLAIALSMAACRKENQEVSQTDEHVSISNTLDSVAFCVVDGERITAAFVRDTVLLTVKVAELGGQKMDPRVIPSWGNSYAMKITPGLISARLIENEAKRAGIHATKESDAAMLEKYNRNTRSRKETKEELADRFGELRGAFLRQFDSESLRYAYFASFPQLQVADEDVDAYYMNLSNETQRLSRIDEDARRKGEAAYSRLLAGEEWDVVAKECSEDSQVGKDNENYFREWGLFLPKNLQSIELASAVEKLEIGGFTRPIETDEGLVIAKLLGKEEDAVDLARIFFRMAVHLEIPPREVAERRIAAEKVTAFQLDLLPTLRDKAKMEYPLGTNFIYRIWDVPKKEKRAKKNRATEAVPVQNEAN